MTTTHQDPAPIWFRRNGRLKRARGSVLELDSRTGLYKVKPARKDWKTIWITVQELQQGGTSAPATVHHIDAVAEMVDSLRILLSRKNAG